MSSIEYAIPLHDKVLVRPDSTVSKTAGGIIIPDNVKEAPTRGEIVSLGTGYDESGNKITFAVKVGDKVVYKKWNGTEVKVNGESMIIMKENEIIAKLITE